MIAFRLFLDSLPKEEAEKLLKSLNESVNEALKLGVKYDLNGETGFIRTGGSNDPKDWVFNNHSYLGKLPEYIVSRSLLNPPPGSLSNTSFCFFLRSLTKESITF